jgi:hypothetical protein
VRCVKVGDGNVFDEIDSEEGRGVFCNEPHADGDADGKFQNVSPDFIGNCTQRTKVRVRVRYRDYVAWAWLAYLYDHRERGGSNCLNMTDSTNEADLFFVASWKKRCRDAQARNNFYIIAGPGFSGTTWELSGHRSETVRLYQGTRSLSSYSLEGKAKVTAPSGVGVHEFLPAAFIAWPQ